MAKKKLFNRPMNSIAFDILQYTGDREKDDIIALLRDFVRSNTDYYDNKPRKKGD